MDTEHTVCSRQGQKYKTLVTDIGNQTILSAVMEGKKVNIAAAAVGDGGGSYYMPTHDMTALVREVWRGKAAGVEINSTSANILDVKVVLPGSAGGFTVRECGLYDDTGALIAVGNLPDAEKSVTKDGISASLTILLHIAITNSAALTFSIDPGIDTASATAVAFQIPQTAWRQTNASGICRYSAEISCEEATAAHTPFAILDRTVLSEARRCSLCPSVEAVSGALRFWSSKLPQTDLNGRVLLVGQGCAGGNSESYTLPAATATTLGGVMVKEGSGLRLDNDGQLSVEVASEEELSNTLNETFTKKLLASDDEVAAEFNDIFGASP